MLPGNQRGGREQNGDRTRDALGCRDRFLGTRADVDGDIGAYGERRISGVGERDRSRRLERVECCAQDRLAVTGVSRDLGDGGDHVEDLLEGEVGPDLA